MISVIIPTINEARQITDTIDRVINLSDRPYIKEIIVVDGGSVDTTAAEAERAGAVVYHSAKGRARQMNLGALQAKGDLLYFLHADSFPSPGYASKICGSVEQGFGSGCFRLRFDLNHWFLKANCWFTQFAATPFRFGDQSLFVKRDLFHQVGGYDEKKIIMEDQDIITRLKKLGRFQVLDDYITTSARKYRENGIFRMQGIFYLIYLMYQMGYSQDELLARYRSLIRHSKI